MNDMSEILTGQFIQGVYFFFEGFHIYMSLQSSSLIKASIQIFILYVLPLESYGMR